MTAKSIMIQGTMSSAGKSLLVTGLCRLFHQEGYRVAPFKSQNMALNSCVTREGLEMGRAQAVQARAAGLEPSVCMNPILLKPTTDRGSQVIVRGEVWKTLDAREYYEQKKKLIPDVRACYEKLAQENDLIIIEGAGSPAEINLRENDFVNMGMAEIADAPVLLVGDIDRGGVFAQLIGTYMLLEESERRRIRGWIINKFRGDLSILEPGLRELEERTGIPVVGVLPYLDIHIEEEDSLREYRPKETESGIDIAVIRLPRISNATDFLPLEEEDQVVLRYVDRAGDLGDPDMIILPGTKSTMQDLCWLRESGLEARILQKAGSSTPVLGICGGYQMLGEELRDPQRVEGWESMRGMGLLPMTTEFQTQKTRSVVTGKILSHEELWQPLSGREIRGYEIHMGCSRFHGGTPLAVIDGKEEGRVLGNTAGTYIHGIFDEDGFRSGLLSLLCRRKDINARPVLSFREEQEHQYDMLAESLREYLDMDAVRSIIGIDR